MWDTAQLAMSIPGQGLPPQVVAWAGVAGGPQQSP